VIRVVVGDIIDMRSNSWRDEQSTL